MTIIIDPDDKCEHLMNKINSLMTGEPYKIQVLDHDGQLIGYLEPQYNYSPPGELVETSISFKCQSLEIKDNA